MHRLLGIHPAAAQNFVFGRRLSRLPNTKPYYEMACCRVFLLQDLHAIQVEVELGKQPHIGRSFSCRFDLGSFFWNRKSL